MTAQAHNTFVYHGRKYCISRIEHDGDFHERDIFDIVNLGLDPECMTTGCWRGYVATFVVNFDNRLSLANLLTNNGNSNSATPNINGVCPKILPPIKGLLPEYKNSRNILYEGLDLALDYSGGIIIASDFIQERYVHGGFQAPWSFRTVIELVFLNGICLVANDLTAIAKNRREQEESGPPDHRKCPEIMSPWVKRHFDNEFCLADRARSKVKLS